MSKKKPVIDEQEAPTFLQSVGYTVKGTIGSGSFGNVYLVYSEKWTEDFVCKIFRLPEDPTAEVSEIQVLMRLYHPNIISMYDFFVHNGFGFLILEYCPGGSLQQMIDSLGGVPTTKLVEYALQVTSALLACHQQRIAHRDIKPANILIDKYGRIKLADFGLAQDIVGDEKSRMIVGSRAYMPPEMFQRKPSNPFLSDIWALGVTFFVMANGTLPWDVFTEQDLEGGITSGMLPNVQYASRAFMKMVRSMLQQNPEKRLPLERVEEILMKEKGQECLYLPSPNLMVGSMPARRDTMEATGSIKESGSLRFMQCLKASPSAGSGLTISKRRKSEISSLLTFPS